MTAPLALAYLAFAALVAVAWWALRPAALRHHARRIDAAKERMLAARDRRNNVALALQQTVDRLEELKRLEPWTQKARRAARKLKASAGRAAGNGLSAAAFLVSMGAINIPIPDVIGERAVDAIHKGGEEIRKANARRPGQFDSEEMALCAQAIPALEAEHERAEADRDRWADRLRSLRAGSGLAILNWTAAGFLTGGLLVADLFAVEITAALGAVLPPPTP